MSRDWKLYWTDIVACCVKIQRYTAGMDQAQFMADEKTRDAVLRNIELIGEAVKHLPPAARDLAPHIAWKKLAGTRDFLAHAYFGIDPDTVWDIVETKIPELLSAMEHVQLP